MQVVCQIFFAHVSGLVADKLLVSDKELQKTNSIGKLKIEEFFTHGSTKILN